MSQSGSPPVATYRPLWLLVRASLALRKKLIRVPGAPLIIEMSSRRKPSALTAPRVIAAGVGLAVRARLGGLAPDQLVEVAALAARGFLLIEKRQLGLVEFREELLPGYFLQGFVVGVERIGEI